MPRTAPERLGEEPDGVCGTAQGVPQGVDVLADKGLHCGEFPEHREGLRHMVALLRGVLTRAGPRGKVVRLTYKEIRA